MQSVNWDDLRYCLAVAKEGSVHGRRARWRSTTPRFRAALPTLEQETQGHAVRTVPPPAGDHPGRRDEPRSAEHMADEVNSIRRLVQADRQELSGKLRR